VLKRAGKVVKMYWNNQKGWLCSGWFPLYALCFLLVSTNAVNGQRSVFWSGESEAVDIFSERLPGPKYADSLQLISDLRPILLQLYQEGYLEASIDAVKQVDSLWEITPHLGPQYTWLQLDVGAVDPRFLKRVGYRPSTFAGKPFYYKEVADLQEDLLSYAENNGYPFAQVWLDSIQFQEGNTQARLRLEKEELIVFDTIHVIGSAKISRAYLANYLGIEKGAPYNRQILQQVGNRIRELPFLKQKRNPTVTFVGKRAVINLFLDRKKASRWDLIAGVLPNNAQTGRTLITGSFTGELQNQFGQGERLFLDFQRLRPEIQELELALSYPFIANLPFGSDIGLEIYRRDSTYRDLIFDFGIQYLFQGGNYLRAFWNQRSTALLQVNEQLLLSTRQLPQNLDTEFSNFGLEYQFTRLDYRFNPRKGIQFKARGGAGVKRIPINPGITELIDEADPTFSFRTLYDSLERRTFQYRLEGDIAYFVPVLSNGALKVALRSGYILSDNPIFQNEQFRLGGNRILRGFDEESIFATGYAVGTVEYRLLSGQNSYFYVFADQAYVWDRNTVRDRQDTPLGFGAGLTFETSVGLFGFSLALGRQQENPFAFRNLKTHFGYVSLF